MSIAQVTNIQQHLDRIFGVNQGYWEYKTIDGEFICYTVRYWDHKAQRKQVRPWTKQNDKLVQGGISEWPNKPIYRIEELKKYPDKPLLFVEGEKTADAAAILFPEYNVLTWLGGSSAVKKLDTTHLINKTVYLFPDNDDTGLKAMKALAEILQELGNIVHNLNPSFLMLPKGWDLADFNEDSCDVDMELIRMMFTDSKPNNNEFDYKYPHMTAATKPRPVATTGNLEYVLNSFNIKVRWNMMNRSRSVLGPNKEFYYEESENVSLTHVTNLAVLNDMPVRRIDKHLDAIALEDRYHPICDWILSRPLVDHDIFQKFLTCLKTTNDDLSYILIKRWMISAVTAAFSTGNFAPQGVLVIHGEQYTHKSSFIMSLAPKEFRAIKGGLILDPSKKDDVLTASQYWIAELAELDATFKKADSNRLKGYINLDEDSIRRPYAMKDSKLIRRTVFAATVNESKFLIDTTGNRRWWTVSITEPINTYHGLDMQQVWREIYEMYLRGEPANLSKQELLMLNGSNETYEYIDPFKEKFGDSFYWDRDPCQWMSASQVLSEIGYDKPSSGDLKRMGDILSKMNWKKGTGRLRYSYYVPQLKPYGYREM